MANTNKEIENKANGQAHNMQQMDDKLQSASQIVQQYSHDIGTQLGTKAAGVSAKASDYVKTSRGYVEENPLQSIVIATAAGLFFGSLFTMILRNKR